MKESKCQRVRESEVRGSWIMGQGARVRFFLSLAPCLLPLILLFTVLTACGKKEEPVKEETKISVVEKKAEVALSAETVSAEAYKGVIVVSAVEGVDWQKGIISATGR